MATSTRVRNTTMINCFKIFTTVGSRPSVFKPLPSAAVSSLPLNVLPKIFWPEVRDPMAKEENRGRGGGRLGRLPRRRSRCSWPAGERGMRSAERGTRNIEHPTPNVQRPGRVGSIWKQCSALSGLPMFLDCEPGRCPGLLCFSPSGCRQRRESRTSTSTRTRRMMRSHWYCQWRDLPWASHLRAVARRVAPIKPAHLAT